MSQTKAQLISPVGILTASGISVTGIVTASSFVGDVTGTASTATNVAITNNTSTDSTYYIHFGSATSGSDGVEVDSSTLTYNPASNTLSTGILSASSKVDVSGNYTQTVQTVPALNIDCSTGNYFTKTINGNSTFTFSNVPSSRAFSFTLELTHTSGTVTWPSEVKWPADTAPTLTTGKTHLFIFVTDDGGTRWRGAALVDYVN